MSISSNANIIETRRIVGNMTDEELREAVKSIPSVILISELYERLSYEEERNDALRSIVAKHR